MSVSIVFIMQQEVSDILLLTCSSSFTTFKEMMSHKSIIHASCVHCQGQEFNSITDLQTTTLPPMRNSRTLAAVVDESSILLRISKTTALLPTRNSRTLTAVAKMHFALKPIYNTTTMRNTQSKYSFILLVCMHVKAFLVFLISHFLSFT